MCSRPDYAFHPGASRQLKYLITGVRLGLVLQPQGTPRNALIRGAESYRAREKPQLIPLPVCRSGQSTLFKKSGLDFADQRVFSLKGRTDFVHKIQYPYKLCRSFTIHEEYVILLTQLAILARTLCTSITRVTRFDTTNVRRGHLLRGWSRSTSLKAG